MKKILIPLILIVCISLTACSSNNAPPGTGANPASTADSAGPKVSDYFAYAKDVHMQYKGTGNEYAAYDTYVDYLKEDTVQVRSLNGGTVVVTVYKLTEDAIRWTFSQEETYFRYDYTAAPSNRDEILIKEPIKEGNSWNLSDGATRTITAVDKDIQTAAGDFKALEVTTKRGDTTEKDYYVKDVGLVKTEFTFEGNPESIVSELEKIEVGVPFKHRVQFFFPEFSKDRVVYMDRDVEIFTNEDMKFKFQRELKTVPENSGLSKVLSADASVLGSELDEQNGTVTVDFSGQLITGMNAGSSLESLILQSITNTFGNYYQKGKVVITVDGKPYESGHFQMEPGEAFNVDNQNIQPFEP